MTDPPPGRPPVVDAATWRRELAELRAAEKAHTHRGDELAARRRRLPMVEITTDYRLRGLDGPVGLLDLFAGRSQLLVYHFMFGPDWDAGCPGCSWVVDAMPHRAHLHARDTSLVAVSRAELDTLERYRTRMGWDIEWYSSAGTTFNDDMGATVDGEEHHGLSAFLRVDDAIFRTYHTTDRGIEHLGSHWTYLDLTPYGRRESWEQSPPGWPQEDPYGWTRRHDEYC